MLMLRSRVFFAAILGLGCLTESDAIAVCTDYLEYPQLRGVVDTPGNASDVAVSGDYAYVADNSNQIRIINLTDLRFPSAGGFVAVGNAAQEIVVSGNYLYVACHPTGLRVLDISNPASPTLVGSAPTNGVPFDLAIGGNYAFVARNQSGFDVLDVSNPTNPQLLFTPFTAQANYVAASASRLVTSYGYRVRVYDIAGSHPPDLVGTLEEEPGFLTSYSFEELAILGDVVHVAFSYISCNELDPDDCSYHGFLRPIDISNPALPDPGPWISVGRVADHLYATATKTYVIGENNGLWVFDSTNPSQPIEDYRILTNGNDGKIAASADDRILCIAKGSNGVAAYDVENTDLPDWVDLQTYTNTFDVAFALNTAYTIGHDNWNGAWILRTYNAANPQNPILIGERTSSGFIGTDIETWGTQKLFLCGYGLWGDGYFYRAEMVVPGGGPQQPVLVTSVPCCVEDVEPVGAYLYAARGSSGLSVLDPSPAGDPTIVTTLPSFPANLIVSEGSLGITVGGGVLRTLDLSNPATPVYVGSESGVSGNWIDLAGTLVAVGSGPDVRLFDVSNPANPAPLSLTTFSSATSAGWIDADILYVAAGNLGLWAIDIANPANPLPAGALATDYASGVRVWNGTVMTCEGEDLSGLPLACNLITTGAPVLEASTTFRMDAAPNPFRSSTTIGFSLPQSGRFIMDLFDVHGRHVRRLLEASDIGAGSVTWDGLDRSGARVSTGVYFVRLQQGDHSHSEKIVRISD